VIIYLLGLIWWLPVVVPVYHHYHLHPHPCPYLLNTFMSVLYTAIDKNVPHRKCTRSRPRHFGHSSRALSKCTAKKRRLWHYLKCNPYDSRAHADYHHCVQQWRRLVKQQQASTEEHIIEANNLGAFYNFVNKHQK